MTFRIYARWPGQRVTQKTTTEDRDVADFAFDKLKASSTELRQQGAIGITYTAEGRSVEYVDLSEEAPDAPLAS